MGCKRWTIGKQLGLRIYTKTINELVPILDVPSKDNRWRNLGEFVQKVNQNIKAKAYSKKIMILSKNKKIILSTMTIAKHGKTTQGYITAPQNTWFYYYVKNNINRDFEFEYKPSSKTDILLIPKNNGDIISELKHNHKLVEEKIGKYCKKYRLVPPPKAKEVGLFYEIKEKEHLEKLGYNVYHRYPYIDSSRPTLIGKRISCDIDVFDNKGNFLKFVEVKSLSAAPGTEFNLTINEFISRKKCKIKNWEYEIVVYYHVGPEVISRKVIKLSDKLNFYPSGYLCSP